MTALRCDITRCTKNPQRWYVTLDKQKLPAITTIEEKLIEKEYKVLAKTPHLRVFKSNKYRFTWHVRGFIQVDVYEREIKQSQQIEQLIKEILKDLEGSS